MTMRHGVLIAQQSRSDPSLNQCQFRTTSHPSILRQTRIGSTDGHHRVPSCIVHSPTPSASDSDEQELDLDMLTNRDSFGDSPIGDIPIDHCAKANDRVSRVRMLPIKREASRESLRSEGRTHLLLHNVGKTIQRTSSQLRRTRLFHLFYAFALPFYTILGAVVFQALDGEHDDRLLKEYQGRCQEERVEKLADVERICEQGGNCFGEMRRLLGEVEKCYRE
ncbi:unnamed protein product, partial [Mesorhabditis belari]|uniref:Uncharacterized protein n=1 Tax=Mesorhabditis belari TaxID=2138241 RepID=A0AAF3ETJ7_9BILA